MKPIRYKDSVITPPKAGESLECYMSKKEAYQDKEHDSLIAAQMEFLMLSCWLETKQSAEKEGIKALFPDDDESSSVWVDDGRIYLSGIVSRHPGDINLYNLAQAAKDLNKPHPLKITMDSPGGSVFDGYAINNWLKNYPGEIHIDVTGSAMSIASHIFLAGDQRTMTEDSWIMVHDPKAGVYGSSKDFTKIAGVLEKMEENMAINYANKTVQHEEMPDDFTNRIERFRGYMHDETWFNAEDSLETGFVHEVAESIDIVNQWDLSEYLHPPKSLLAIQNAQKAREVAQKALLGQKRLFKELEARLSRYL